MDCRARIRHRDVTNTINISDPDAVLDAITTIVRARYPDFPLGHLRVLMADFSRLYRGEFPGYHGCDVQYHDMEHVLDVTLAMVRLLDGHEQQAEVGVALGPRRVLAGIASALFHDAGYIRKRHDARQGNGAAYTIVHVSRGAAFLEDYLPTIDLADIAPLCALLVHFTGYERDPETIDVATEQDRVLGEILGTADLLAQMADSYYLEKCRDHLYREFEIAGVAADDVGYGLGTNMQFQSPSHLLQSTPGFIRSSMEVRLERYFRGAYHYAEIFFGGRNLYLEGIKCNQDRLALALENRGGSLS